MSETETNMHKSDWTPLLDELRDWFNRGEVEAPARQVLKMPQPDGSEASLLLMPAWVPGKAIGVKVVTFLPENARAGRPVIHSGYMLFDGETGALVSASEAESLTARRTAAVSALGADYLARADAGRLLVVGTGQLAPFMASAHASVRSYKDITVWGRNPDRANVVAEKLRRAGLPARPVTDLEPACAEADVITTVTASTEPVVRGSWLRRGTHLDLVGAFREDMREFRRRGDRAGATLRRRPRECHAFR